MIIEHHPGFLQRWANIYVEKYLKYGPAVAKEWAMKHLSKSNIKAITPLVQQRFKELGR